MMTNFRLSWALSAIAFSLLAAPCFASPAVLTPSGLAVPHPAFLTLLQLRARYGDAAGHLTNIDGVEIYYKDQGRGPAILLLHGSVCSQLSWDPVADALVKKYRVIRFDVPGQGLSGPISDFAAATTKPADIPAGLLDRLGIKSAIVIGFSSGGTLGIDLAAARPDLVERLIISNAPADPVSTVHLHVSPALAVAEATARRTGFQSQAFWNAFLDFFSYNPGRISSGVRQEFYDINRRIPQPNAIALVAKVADHDEAVAAMSKVRCPVLLIWGNRDPLLPPAAEAALKSYLKNASVTETNLPDVGHFVPIEAPAAFTRIVEAYLSKAGSINN